MVAAVESGNGERQCAAMTARTAFLVECSGDHWLNIGRELTQAGIRPILWTADPRTLVEVAAHFPAAFTVSGVDAACNRMPPAAAPWPRTPLDGPTLRALAADEAIALAMMDRMDPDTGAFDHDSRRRHWHDLLRTWGAVLDRLAPDIVIFSIAPHIIFDWALYALCKHRGVPTLMFERTSLPGRLLLVERFEDGSAALAEALRARDAARMLSDAARAHIAGLRAGGAAALPPNYRKKLTERGLLRAGGRQAALGFARTLGFEARRLAYVLVRRTQAPSNYLLRETPAGELASPSAGDWLRVRWHGQTKKRRLRSLLAGLTRTPDLDRPFVLLALHYQPERAIVPMAGALGDQTLIVDMLASALPEGWQLVVKEHPWQLAEMGRGELGRSAGFYRRLASHAMVVLCPPEANTTGLLNRSRAVATATGSIGWQAVARGKPALVFGAAWYRGCPGTYAIDSLQSCRDALAEIAGGAVPAPDAAEIILAAVEAVSVTGFLEPALEDLGGLDEGDAVSGMSRALISALAPKSACAA